MSCAERQGYPTNRTSNPGCSNNGQAGRHPDKRGIRAWRVAATMLLRALAGFSAWPTTVHASPEEIVIFADEGDKPGQFGYELHVNYAARSRGTPDYPGEQPPQGVLRFMPELSYGLSDSWNLGLHLPMSHKAGSTTVDGFKLRFTNVNRRETDWGSWFYGANYELSCFATRLSESRVVAEVLGILGMRYRDWLFVVNPEVGRALKSNTRELDRSLDFDLNLKVMKKVGGGIAVGIEHYGELGKAERPEFGVTSSQITYATIEFATKSRLEFNIGVGHGWTDSVDRLVFKAIVGLPF